MLRVLDLFTEDTPVLGVEEIGARLKYSRPTGYRYVRELVSSGLLVRGLGGYSLGPRIIELDYLIRLKDPILLASRQAVRELAADTGFDVTQMSMYGERIVTIHRENGSHPLEISYGRGRPMPLFRGAPSRAILAFMPRARLERLHRKYHRGRGFARFYEEMQAIRRAGYSTSQGELDVDRVGYGAPVFRGGRNVAGCVCVVMTRQQHEQVDPRALVEKLLDTAARISDAIEPLKITEPLNRSTNRTLP